MALTDLGFVWGWGTFRDSSGVLGFSPTQRIALVPTLVHEPAAPESQAVKIASGVQPFPGPVLVPRLRPFIDCPSAMLKALRCEAHLFRGPSAFAEHGCICNSSFSY